MINKKLVEKNFSSASQQYSQSATVQEFASLDLLEKLTKYKILQNNQLALDLGCGPNGHLQYSYQDTSGKVINFDISNQMLSLVKKNYEKGIFVQGDMDWLPFKSCVFDLIFSSFAIQWSQNIELLFTELAKLTKRNGLLALAIPNDFSLGNLKLVSRKTGCNFIFKEMPNHDNMLKLIKNLGAKVLEIGKYSFYEKFDNPLQAIRNIKKIGANYNNSTKNFISKKSLLSLLSYDKIVSDYFENDWNISYFIVKIN